MSETKPMSAPLTKRLRCVPQSIEDACQTMEDAATRIEELEPKAAAYEACSSKIDCLSRGAVPVRDDGAERIRELEAALRSVMQRANEGRGDQMSLNETIYAMHRIAGDALQPKDTAK